MLNKAAVPFVSLTHDVILIWTLTSCVICKFWKHAKSVRFAVMRCQRMLINATLPNLQTTNYKHTHSKLVTAVDRKKIAEKFASTRNIREMFYATYK